MPDPEKFSAGQFKYRFHQHEQGGEEHITVGAFHPETGEGVGMLTLGRDPSMTKKQKMNGVQKDRFEPRVAYTRPEFRRLGIGSTMANVARYEQPGHSVPLAPTRDLSPMGLEFTKSYFGEGEDTPTRATTPNWINTDAVDANVIGTPDPEREYGRSFDAPALQKVTGPGSRESELARGLVPKLPDTGGGPEPKYTQGTMFRKVGGKLEPTKAAMPKEPKKK